MTKCVFIVQGEGRGHMSQSIALKEYLDEAGHVVEAVFVGRKNTGSLPDYFMNCFSDRIIAFRSPYFLSTPNRKGIYVGRTLLFNLLRSFIYIREAGRIRRKINKLHPDAVFNFYDVVGALALRKVHPSIRRIGIGHHFYLHLKGYFGLTGSVCDRLLLTWHTRIIMKSCDRVMALSYSEQKGDSKIEVVPPLIRKEYRDMNRQPGKQYLVYLLKEGFIYDLIMLARKDPEFQADVFIRVLPDIEIPSSIRMHREDGNKFRVLMTTCRGLITTAGFDTSAEAAYHGIPLAVIPVRNHFEQRCNSLDIDMHGIGTKLDHLEPGIQHHLKASDNREFRRWVERSGEMILNSMTE
ncbi:MAG: glycosyltransferase family protein [Bacteroidota bacterium]